MTEDKTNPDLSRSPTSPAPEVLLAPRSPQAAREVRRDTPLRKARTCYDHLAGVAGVRLLDELLQHGWLRQEPGPRTLFRLTSAGDRALVSLGVDVPGAVVQRRPFAYGCLDWTERRYHLRGSLAAAILSSLATSGAVLRTEGTRSAVVNRSLSEWLES